MAPESTPINSTVTFTKTLRSSSIPLTSRLAVAQAAITTNSFYLPRKLQYLLSWALENLALEVNHESQSKEYLEIWRFALAVLKILNDQRVSAHAQILKRKRTPLNATGASETSLADTAWTYLVGALKVAFSHEATQVGLRSVANDFILYLLEHEERSVITARLSPEDGIDLLSIFLDHDNMNSGTHVDNIIADLYSASMDSVANQKRIFLDKCVEPLAAYLSRYPAEILPPRLRLHIQDALFSRDVLVDLSRTNDLNKAPVIKKLKSMLLQGDTIPGASELTSFSFECFLTAVDIHSSGIFTVTTKALATREDTLRKRKLVHDVFWAWADPLVAHLTNNDSQNNASLAKMLRLLDSSRIIMATNDDLWKQHLIQLSRLVQKCMLKFNQRLDILEALMQTEYTLVTTELVKIDPEMIAGILANDTASVDFTISRVKVAAQANDLASVLKSLMYAIYKADHLPANIFPKSIQHALSIAVRDSLTAPQTVSLIEQATELIQKIETQFDASAASRFSNVIKLIVIVLDNCKVSEKQQSKVNQTVQLLFETLLKTSILHNSESLTLKDYNSQKQSLLVAETDSIRSLLLVADVLRSNIHQHLETHAATFIVFSDLKWFQKASNADYAAFASFMRYIVCILDTGGKFTAELKDTVRRVFKAIFAVFEVLITRVDHALASNGEVETFDSQLSDRDFKEVNIVASIWSIIVHDSINLLNSAGDEENVTSFAHVLIMTLNASAIGPFRHLRSISQALLNRADFWELPIVRSAFIERLSSILHTVYTNEVTTDDWTNAFQIFKDKAALVDNLTDIISILPINALDRKTRSAVLTALVHFGGTMSNSISSAIRARRCLGDFVLKAGSSKGLDIMLLLSNEWLSVKADVDKRFALHEGNVHALQAILKQYFASKRDAGQEAEGDEVELAETLTGMEPDMSSYSREFIDDAAFVTTLDWTAVLLLPYMKGAYKDKLMQNLRLTIESVFAMSDLTADDLPLLLLLCKVAIPLFKDDGLCLIGLRSCSKALSDREYYENSFSALYVTFVDVMINSFDLPHLVNNSKVPADVALALLFGPDDTHTVNRQAVGQFTSKLNQQAYESICQECLVSHQALWKDSQRRQKLTDLLPIVLENRRDDCRLTARSFYSNLVQSICSRLAQPLSLENLMKQSNLLSTLEMLINIKDTTLQAREVNIIFVIVTMWLAPHAQHIERGDRIIFQTLCRIILPICRSYRHVIIKSLPLVTRMLQLMLRCLAAPRQDVQLPADSLVQHPIWLNPLHVQSLLGSVEAEMVARIVTTLCWKTPITSKLGIEANVSLIKPFSKHAPSILGEFIRIETDRLVRISVEGHEHRRNLLDVLTPGVWALCEVVGQHERDALIVNLNSAGKALLQSVWTDWSKYGKYTGQ